MKIIVFGGTGMLGHNLVRQFRDKFDVWTTVRGKINSLEKYDFFDRDRVFDCLNIFESEAVENIIEKIKPDVVINCVGIIKQLPVSKDVITTLTVNAIFPHRLAEFSQKYGFRLLTISTDCVFKGTIGNYKEENEADASDLYGRSKNLGEVLQKNCLTIRTSIIGRELASSHSLVDWFLSNENGKVKGFTKAIYSGFPTIIFADILANIMLKYPDLEGLYHISSEPINKYELLRMLKKAYRAQIEIEPFDDFEIDRSLNSDKFRAETGFLPTDWEEMIERMAADNSIYKNWKK